MRGILVLWWCWSMKCSFCIRYASKAGFRQHSYHDNLIYSMSIHINFCKRVQFIIRWQRTRCQSLFKSSSISIFSSHSQLLKFENFWAPSFLLLCVNIIEPLYLYLIIHKVVCEVSFGQHLLRYISEKKKSSCVCSSYHLIIILVAISVCLSTSSTLQ